MRREESTFARGLIAAACLALCASVPAHAQGRGGGGPPPGGGGPGGGGMGGPQFPGGGSPPGGGGMGGPGSAGGPGFPDSNRGGLGAPGNVPRGESAPRGNQPDGRMGLQLGPPGQRWWDDHSFVKSLKLRPEQQAHMDAIFEQNRAALVARFESVQQAEAQMAELAGSPAPDEAALFAQIDRVAQARAELEKTNTHMLLELRKELDAEQIKRLESKR